MRFHWVVDAITGKAVENVHVYDIRRIKFIIENLPLMNKFWLLDGKIIQDRKQNIYFCKNQTSPAQTLINQSCNYCKG